MWKNDPKKLGNQREGNKYSSADSRKMFHEKAQRERSGGHSENVRKVKIFIIYCFKTLL